MNSNRVWGGGEKWHYETACYLDELGYSVLVVTNKNSDLFDKLKDHPGIEVAKTAVSNIGFLNPFKIWFLKRLFQKHGRRVRRFARVTGRFVGGIPGV